MAVNPGECQFKNGAWECNLHSPSKRPIKAWIIGDRTFLNSATSKESLQIFLGKADKCIDEAAKYAMLSPYRSDIEECGGFSFDSIVVVSWSDLRVWFNLNGPSQRMLAVQVVSDTPMDVFCDHPD
jgi:hypothetical protein